MKATAFWIHHLLHLDTPLLDPVASFRPSHTLRRMGAWLSQRLCGANEPRVWRTNGADALPWHVYDPVSNQYAEFSDESEVRIWLEKRYNQPSPALPMEVLR